MLTRGQEEICDRVNPCVDKAEEIDKGTGRNM